MNNTEYNSVTFAHAFNRGKWDCKNGNSLSTNPYDMINEIILHNAWKEGYYAEQDKNTEEFIIKVSDGNESKAI